MIEFNACYDQPMFEQSKMSTIPLNTLCQMQKNKSLDKKLIENYNFMDRSQQDELDFSEESRYSGAANVSINNSGIPGLEEINSNQSQINANNVENQIKNKKICNKNEIKKKKKKDFSNFRSRFRTSIMKFHVNVLKEGIKTSVLPEKLKKYQIKSPNHKAFNGRTTSSKVIEEFEQSIKNILCGPYIEKERHKHYGLKKNQIMNKKYIEQIEEYYNENPSQSVKEILELINMKYRRVIEIFYDTQELKEFKDFQVFKELTNLKESKEFTAFKNIKDNQDDDERFNKRYHYSLFDKNGFIKYYEEKEENDKNAREQDGKMTGKKRKMDKE